jgi:hypothetical protein
MSDEDRRQLAAAQADLLNALTGGAETPADLDPARVALAVRSLLKKRARAVERTWPAAASAPDFDRKFARFAATRPDPANAGADGLAFARWLLREGLLHDAGRVELLTRIAWRGWPVRVMRTADGRGFWVAVRWWRIGVRSYAVRWRASSSDVPTRPPPSK